MNSQDMHKTGGTMDDIQTGDFVSYRTNDGVTMAGTPGRVGAVGDDMAVVYWNSGASGVTPLVNLARRLPNEREAAGARENDYLDALDEQLARREGRK